jgi:arginine repressor
MANAIAVCVDSLYHDDIVGSVAGDDTILLVSKSAESAELLAKTLKDTFGKSV